MAKGDDLEERCIDFAVRIIKLSDNLPNTRAGNHVSRQVLRSGTAPAALHTVTRDWDTNLAQCPLPGQGNLLTVHNLLGL